MRYRNVSNPAAFGVEWTSTYGGRVQLVCARTTTWLTLGLAPAVGGEWLTARVAEPERFGLTEPPRNFNDFMRVVQAYWDGGAA